MIAVVVHSFVAYVYYTLDFICQSWISILPIILVGKYYVDSVGTECVALAPVVAPVVAFAFAQLFFVDNFLFLAEPVIELSVDIVVIVDTVGVVAVVANRVVMGGLLEVTASGLCMFWLRCCCCWL